jgi:hypothetical protein
VSYPAVPDVSSEAAEFVPLPTAIFFGHQALVDINDGVPVGALLLAPSAVAGDIWTDDGYRSMGRP